MPVPLDPDAPWVANAILTLLVTALVTWGSVMVATRAQRREASEARQIAAAVLEQVDNKHPIGLRDDLDAKVAALAAQLGRMADTQQATRDDIRETRRDIGGLRADARTDREQLAALRGRVDQITDQMAGGRQ